MSNELKPGWVDEAARKLAAALRSGDEKARSEALGLQPRRCFRKSQAEIEASRRRGSQRGGVSNAADLKLGEVKDGK